MRADLPQTETRKPKFFYGYVIAAASFFIVMVVWGTFYTFGVFFDSLLTEFGWTRTATSAAVSISGLIHGSLAMPTGRLTDRFGPRIVTVSCGLLLGLGYLLMSQVSAIWQFYLFYGVILGAGMSGAWVPTLSTVARWFVKRRGMMTGIVVSGIGVGTIIIPSLATRLIYIYGWRTSYIIIGIVVLAVVTLAAQFLRRDPQQIGLLPYGEDEVKAEDRSAGAKGLSLQGAIHTRQFWMLATMFFFFTFAVSTIMVHIVVHAIGLGISAIVGGNIIAIIGGTSVVGRLTLGTLGDRMGNKRILMISFLMISAALFWLLAAKEIQMLYLFAAIFGFAYGGLFAIEPPLTAELFGLRSHGVLLGVMEFFMATGTAVGPVLVGWLFDITESYNPGFIICGILAIVGFILASLVRPTSIRGGGNDSVGGA